VARYPVWFTVWMVYTQPPPALPGLRQKEDALPVTLSPRAAASGVILAGGKSRRMGCDKLRLEVDGVPLILRVYEALSDRCAEVVVVGEGGAWLQGVSRISDERPGAQGPLAGLEAGLAAVTNRLVFVAAGDLPFLNANLVGYLLASLEERGACAVVPRYRGRIHPLCAAYDREVLQRVRAALDEGVLAVHRFLEVSDRVEYVEEELRWFGDPDIFLMNVNSPEDLDLARARCGARRETSP
jgi:molybdopterin-guanine dinucleotide biosynthesis protein A